MKLFKEKGIQLRNEKGISIEELEEGMVLSRSLYTSKGRFLLPYNTILTKDYIYKLGIIHKSDPISSVIYVNG